MTISPKEYLSTGCNNLNNMLYGGISTGCITQFYGGPGSGKTEICCNVCALVAPEYKTMIISTGSKFRLERIEAIAEARGLDVRMILQNTLIRKVSDTNDFQRLIKSAQLGIESDHTIKLLIVDSIIELYRADESFHRQLHLPYRQQELSKNMFILSNIATTNNVAVLITNQVLSGSLFWSGIVPTGGYLISLLSNYVVYLKKGSSNGQHTEFSARLTKDPCDSKSNVKFTINSMGISDIL